MSSYIQADNGSMVIAEGAPGSVARVRVQFPVLIEILRRNRRAGGTTLNAHFLCACAGVHQGLERESLMQVVNMPQEMHPIEFEI